MRQPHAAKAFVLLSLALSGCAGPEVASRCSVRKNPGDHLIATVTLTNRSPKTIVKTHVLIDTKRVHPASGNRLFEVVAQIAPGETRTVDGRVMDDGHYDFKNSMDAHSGCELDQTVFKDGTTWESPSPL